MTDSQQNNRNNATPWIRGARKVVVGLSFAAVMAMSSQVCGATDPAPTNTYPEIISGNLRLGDSGRRLMSKSSQSRTSNKAGKSITQSPTIPVNPTPMPTTSKSGKSTSKAAKSATTSKAGKAGTSPPTTSRPTSRSPTGLPTALPTPSQPSTTTSTSTTSTSTTFTTSTTTTSEPVTSSSSSTTSTSTTTSSEPSTTSATSSTSTSTASTTTAAATTTTTITAATTTSTPEPTAAPTSSPTAQPTESGFVPAPNVNCADPITVDGVVYEYTCLQNDDFGVEDTSRFKIDLNIQVTEPDHVYAFTRAIEKWESIIVGDMPSTPRGDIPAAARGPCENDLPASVDDLYICSRDVDIDGRGGVLGSAAPMFLRTNQDTGKVTSVTGRAQFDVTDIPFMIQFNRWYPIILHEFAHIIGFGTLFDDNGLLSNDMGDDRNPYLGTNANNVWQNEFGCDGAPPMQMGGGHWTEECFVREAMTGGINDEPTPVSTITVASFEDIGYEVNYAAADEYQLPPDNNCCNPGITDNDISSGSATRPPLSEDARNYANIYGQQLLQERQLDASILEEAEDMGLDYVGDKVVVVLMEENGFIYDVHVKRE